MYIKCVYRMGSSQRLLRIMRAWERPHNFIILKKEYAGLKANHTVL